MTTQTPSSPISLYERMGERTTQPFAMQMLDKLAPIAGRSVVDVAAGTGGLAVAAAERGAHVLATDISPQMIERTQDRLRPFPLSTAEVMDFKALRIPDASFDVSVSNFGILAFPTWSIGLDEMVRVTRPGGRIALAMWTQEDDCSPAHLMRRVFRGLFPYRELWPAGFFPEFSQRDLESSLHEAGCEDVHVHVMEAPWSPYSSAGVVDECHPMFKGFAGYAALNTEEATGMRDALQAEFDSYADAEGTISLPTRAFVVLAKKPKLQA